MQVKLVDVVILLKIMSEHVCLGEIKTRTHVSGRGPYLSRNWYDTSTVQPEIIRIQNQLKGKCANTLSNPVFLIKR